MKRIHLGLLFMIATVGPLLGQEGPIRSGTARVGTLSFDGHATMGDFTGTTDTVTGEFEGAAELSGVSGWVEALVTTLVTGNGKRDRDLNKSMESEQFPKIRFELDSVSAEAGAADSLPVTLHGHLIIHGVTRDVALPGVLSLGGEAIRIRSTFPLNLKDYKIGGLTKMLGMLKMHEDIVVHVDVTFGYR